MAVDLEGKSEMMVRVPTTIPFCIDWLRDGRLIVISGQESLVLRHEPEGGLVPHADMRAISDQGWNEIVVDGRGNAHINGDPGVIAMPTPDGSVLEVADGLAFPIGMALTPDNSTLIIAESHGKRLTAFDIAADGGLSNRRVWAALGDGVPDGICIDTRECRLVRGGSQQTMLARPRGRGGAADYQH